MSTQPKPDTWHVPAGYELAAHVDEGWRVQEGSPCRYARQGHHQCGRHSAAALLRGTDRKQWWAYCPEHSYGRWVENGRVWSWRLRKIQVTDESWHEFVEGHTDEPGDECDTGPEYH